MEKLTGSSSTHANGDVQTKSFGNMYTRGNGSGPQPRNNQNFYDDYVEDLEDHHAMPGVIPTISNQVSNHMSMANGHLGGVGGSRKVKSQPANGFANGGGGGGRPNLRSMLQDAEMNSHI